MLFPIFVIATLLELYVIIAVGNNIGAFNTVMLVVITAFIGSFLLKQQGFSTLRKAQHSMMQGQNPSFEMLEGVVIMVSGILLLTPGFITDTVGLLGLMPWSRELLLIHFLQKNTEKIFKTTQTTKEKDAIEGEFWED
ncbi:Protein affecting phage T7 exclusion by the F plasmid [hydrothermal vent metagenome]|uniref:Protein affecting phage T7 exclusion by the F plasmid n=1 Tax=hydrothermal vent metagenome TaxID=652676 RepID=A0A1W1CSD3_9ZZZZ